MDPEAGQRQIKQMITFIHSEAQDKAAEIQKKGDEEFSIEVHRLITDCKEKLRRKYELDVKKRDTQAAIAKSLAINKQRLEKIKARQDVMGKIADEVKAKLAQELKNDSTSKPFIAKLIAQGLLMLLEAEVSVRCKESDSKKVESCLADAAKEYSTVVKKETGIDKSVQLKVDKQKYLPESCLGGIVLACANDKITIDNTVDVRLKLIMEQDKPAIRRLLFGGEAPVANSEAVVNGGPTTQSPAPVQAAAAPAAAPAAVEAAAAPQEAAAAAAPAAQSKAGGGYQVGTTLTARYQDGSMHRCTIVSIDVKKKKNPYKVNWEGFASNYDTWIGSAEIQQ